MQREIYAMMASQPGVKYTLDDIHTITGLRRDTIIKNMNRLARGYTEIRKVMQERTPIYWFER